MSFGCSWAFGDELLDPELEKQGIPSHYTQNDSYRLEHCYTGLLASYYNLTQENLSFPGSSLQSMQWNLMWWIKNHTEEYIRSSMLVVGLTDESRVSWYDPKHERGIDDPEWNNYLHAQWLDGAGPNVDRGWFNLHKNYLAMTACSELYQLNYDTTVRLFDGVCARYEIPVIQFNAIATTNTNANTLYDIDIRDIVNNNYKQHGHPNEKGHQLIANKLINIIDTHKK